MKNVFNRDFFDRKFALGLVGLLMVLGVYSIISVHFRHVGLMAPDESYFTLAARLVYEGKMPYRDFAYMQMPLMPYINGAVLNCIGFSLDNHRLLSSIWGGIGLAAIAVALRQRFGRFEPALIAVFAVAAAPRWGFLQSMGVWCGVAGLFLNLALSAVIWRGALKSRILVFAIAGTVTIGCRLSQAPLVAILACVLLIEAPNIKFAAKTLLGFVVVGCVAIVPFVLVDPEAFYFMNWQYHMESEETRSLATKALQGWDVSPSAIVIQAIGLLAIPSLIVGRKWTEFILLVAGLVGLVVPLIPDSAWGSYISPSVPLASVAGVCAIWTAGMAENNPHRHLLWFLPILSLFHITPLEVIEGAATEGEEMGAYIREEVPPGPVLTPATIVAIEAGRDVVHGTEMGHFAAMYPWDQERASRFEMTTLPELTRIVEDQVPAAIVLVVEPQGWRVWNFQWALPLKEVQPAKYIRDFEDAVEMFYKPAWRTSAMEVLVRRDKW
jgi:hypothetical protein